MASVDTYAFTADRIVATVAAVTALGGVIAAGGALARARRRWAPAALAAGTAGVVVGAFVVITADGGPGTGNGIVGGYAAVVLGATAVLLAGLASVRSRRTHEGRPG